MKKNKIQLKIILTVSFSVLFVFLIRQLVRGRAGNSIVSFMERAFHIDNNSSLFIYQMIIRSNIDMIIIIAIILCVIISSIVILSYSRNQRIKAERLAQKQQNELIASLAHDLRTPLTSIIGYLSLISDSKQNIKTSAKYAEIAFDKAKQLEGLIESLFDISFFTMGEVKVHKDELDLKKFLLQKQDEFYPLLEKSQMEIRLFLPNDIPLVFLDGNLMARVFDNLIANSIRYAKEGKFIDIKVNFEEKSLLISFVTHSNPIPNSDLERIFDKLYRIEKSRNKATGGTGLGLSISRQIVELHGGTLTARQTPDGTAFDIKMPIS